MLAVDGTARAEGPETGVDGTPMELEFLIDGSRRRAAVLLGDDGLDAGETVRVAVDWGDSTPLQVITSPDFYSHTYAGTVPDGTVTVRIWPLYADTAGGSDEGPWLTLYGADRTGEGGFRWTALGDTPDEDDADVARMTGVVSFGDLGIESLRNAFNSHHALTVVPASLPTSVTDLSAMFRRASTFNGANIVSWNTVNITDLRNTFRYATAFDQPIGGWDVSSVTDMDSMFEEATSFDQPLTGWDVSSVTDMENMFEGATAFNGDISTWKDRVSNVTDFSDFLKDATSFNQDLPGWDVSGSDDLDSFFEDATAFDGSLEGWTFSSTVGVDLSNFFEGATSFNQPLSGWTTTSIDDLNDIFKGATSFDQPIGNWDVSNVTNMNDVFEDATSFDQPVGDWDVSSATNMSSMFDGATSFDRSLADWSLNPSVSLSGMFDGSGMSSSCYDATLVGWATQDSVTGRSLGASGVEYSPTGAAARTTLIDDRSWSISGDSDVAEASGRCAGDVGTEVVTAAPADGPGVACTPADPSIGETVTCDVSGGDPDIDILWRAAADDAPLDEGAVRIGPDGLGTFTFVATEVAPGQTLSVELVAWTQPVAVGTVGGPQPTVVRAGEGFGGIDRLPAALVPVAILALLLGAPLMGGRRAGRASRG